MAKKSKNPFQMLAECVGAAIVTIATIPVLIIDGAISVAVS